MIKALNELIWLADKNTPDPEAHIAFLCGHKKEIVNLYHAIRNHDFRSDEEAIKGAKIGERTTYKKYGRQLLRHLRDLALHYDQPNDDYARAKCEGFRLLAQLKMLVHNSGKIAAFDVARELHRLGLHYDRPEWVMEAAKAMMHTAALTRDRVDDIEIFGENFLAYKEHHDTEVRAEFLYESLRLKYLRKKGFQAELERDYISVLNELEPLAGKVPSVTFHLIYYSLAVAKDIMCGRYPSAIAHAEEAVRYFESRPYSAPAVLHGFYFDIVQCFNQLNNYEQGDIYIKKCLECAREGTVNWFSTYETWFHLSIRSGRYDQAFRVWECVTTHKRFSVQRAMKQETWLILGAYLYIAVQLTGKSMPPDCPVPVYKSTKFLNDINVFQQDKTGMNVAALIAHVLLQWLEGRYDELFDRAQALDKYRERYLRETGSERAALFLKILIVLARADFQYRRFFPKSEALFLRLETASQKTSPYEMEVIPFTQLYKMMVDRIKNTQPVVRPAMRMPVIPLERSVASRK